MYTFRICGQVPEFLVQYYNGIPAHFSVQQFGSDLHTELSMRSAEVDDSALYLCASSLTTLPPVQKPPAQKHSCPAQEETRGCQSFMLRLYRGQCLCLGRREDLMPRIHSKALFYLCIYVMENNFPRFMF